MALWQADGELNAVDNLIQKPAAGTTSITNFKEGQTTGRVYTKDAQIIVNDGTYDRILIGFQSGGF